MIPYAVKGIDVTPAGFIRDEPDLADKKISTY